MSQLALSFKEQISSFHRKSLELDEQIRAKVIEKLNITRAAGITLSEARSSLPSEEFRGIVSDLDLEAFD